MAAQTKGWVCDCWLAEMRVRIPPGHGCLSLVSVACYLVEVSATGQSLVQTIPTECGMSMSRITRGYFTCSSPVSSVASY